MMLVSWKQAVNQRFMRVSSKTFDVAKIHTSKKDIIIIMNIVPEHAKISHWQEEGEKAPLINFGASQDFTKQFMHVQEPWLDDE